MRYFQGKRLWCQVAYERSECAARQGAQKLRGGAQLVSQEFRLVVAIGKSDCTVGNCIKYLRFELRGALMGKNKSDLLRATFIKNGRNLLVSAYHVVALVDVDEAGKLLVVPAACPLLCRRENERD